MKFTPADRADPMWQRLRAYIVERIEYHRTQNDNDLTPEQTAKVRGRIAELTGILRLSEDRPEEFKPEEF